MILHIVVRQFLGEVVYETDLIFLSLVIASVVGKLDTIFVILYSSTFPNTRAINYYYLSIF